MCVGTQADKGKYYILRGTHSKGMRVGHVQGHN